MLPRLLFTTTFNVGKPLFLRQEGRLYHARVIDHYENPRNVGSFDKKDKNVGTGLVGAPACFHGDTLIATANGISYAKLIDIYESKEKIPVWSFHIAQQKYEIKWAIAIKTGKRKMVTLSFDDGGTVRCTRDHKFLTRGCDGIYEYVENQNLKKDVSAIVAFDRISCEIDDPQIFRRELTQKDADEEEEWDCYNLQVEENNNYVVMISMTPKVQMGICVRNCGDVIKLQIRVDPETDTIIDSKFKTFGCLAGNVKIATPKGYVQIKSLSVNDTVYAWNGKDIVENEIEEINIKWVNYKKLLRFEFEGSCHFQFICSNDHIWWLASDTPIEAKNLNIGDELLHITENELRSRNNIGRTDWMKQKASDTMTLTNSSNKIDRSKMPQHQKGKSMEHLSDKISIGMKKRWNDPEYVKRWQKGMDGASNTRPTSVEKIFIELFEKNNIDCRYVGDSQFWCSVKGKKGGINPDFKVNGQSKVIEVYDSKMPKFMMDRSNDDWINIRTNQFEESGFKSLFLNIRDTDANEMILEVQNFIHNGLKVVKKTIIVDKRQLRGLEKDNDNVKLYDIRLKEGANVFFAGRVGTHNCGSAIATSSYTTEAVKGKTFDEALSLKDMDIAKHLFLPPVKYHCAKLSEDAIAAAIADYRKKQN